MTPAECAVSRIADPRWRFDTDPMSAVSDAVTKATEHAIRDHPLDWEGHADRARYWAAVACLLVDAASNPHITRGVVLNSLVARYGIAT